MGDLTVCSVVCNDNRSKLFDLMVKSVLRFTKHIPEFIICDSGGNNLNSYQSLPNFTIMSNTSISRGSLQHGEGLNKIVSLSKTKYTAIIESDCILLSDEWLCINDNYKMVGAKKAKDIYHVCFLLFKTESIAGVDFRPGTAKNRSNRSYQVHEDVGWRIKEHVLSNEVQELRFVDCKTGDGKFFSRVFQSDEFWINGNPVLAHFGRGSHLAGKATRKNLKPNDEQLKEWKIVAEKLIGE
jgi:hypothetical protein